MCLHDGKVLVQFQSFGLGGRDAGPVMSPSGEAFSTPAEIAPVSWWFLLETLRGASLAALPLSSAQLQELLLPLGSH